MIERYIDIPPVSGYLIVLGLFDETIDGKAREEEKGDAQKNRSPIAYTQLRSV